MDAQTSSPQAWTASLSSSTTKNRSNQRSSSQQKARPHLGGRAFCVELPLHLIRNKVLFHGLLHQPRRQQSLRQNEVVKVLRNELRSQLAFRLLTQFQ